MSTCITKDIKIIFYNCKYKGQDKAKQGFEIPYGLNNFLFKMLAAIGDTSATQTLESVSCNAGKPLSCLFYTGIFVKLTFN